MARVDREDLNAPMWPWFRAARSTPLALSPTLPPNPSTTRWVRSASHPPRRLVGSPDVRNVEAGGRGYGYTGPRVEVREPWRTRSPRGSGIDLTSAHPDPAGRSCCQWAKLSGPASIRLGHPWTGQVRRASVAMGRRPSQLRWSWTWLWHCVRVRRWWRGPWRRWWPGAP